MLRNIAILLVIAAVVAFVPGGGRAANLVSAVLSIAFAGGLAFFFGRQYMERRTDLYTLEDRHRGFLYGAVGVGAVTIAAASRLTASAAGTVAFVALLGAVAYVLVFVYRAWRQY
jgi:TRAP-type C4-dicarboxylate transport system permease small subunit